MTALYTPWGEQLDRTCPLPEYPRPQLRRDSYLCLNCLWDYTVEDGDEYSRRRSGKILVPFSPESLLSGCDFRLQSGETLWQERRSPCRRASAGTCAAALRRWISAAGCW
ncbi:MAG: hypothetical protein ACLVGA_10270 [Dysosmobacter sp.]